MTLLKIQNLTHYGLKNYFRKKIPYATTLIHVN